MATNFDSAYHLSQIAHPLLKASGAGSIVFISSVADLMHLGTGSIYGASKGEAMNQLARTLACEWTKDNIRTNCVAPWYIRTSLVEHSRIGLKVKAINNMENGKRQAGSLTNLFYRFGEILWNTLLQETTHCS
uniref:Tropinone reductase-like n=1 Tax=Populus alba TaxID=43335 RepID=A0A4U5QZH0_POPAL|nr:hypothetical protein D5086_0000015940 [Populus alba]